MQIHRNPIGHIVPNIRQSQATQRTDHSKRNSGVPDILQRDRKGPLPGQNSRVEHLVSDARDLWCELHVVGGHHRLDERFGVGSGEAGVDCDGADALG